MADKIKCPKVDGIYCLEYFWNHKAMVNNCRQILSAQLEKKYKDFVVSKEKSNSLLRNERRGVVSLCPGHHEGQLGKLRLVMIKNPMKSKRGLVCLLFPVYHKGQDDKEYQKALDKAEGVYDAAQQVTFADETALKKFKQEGFPQSLQDLVKVGFYDIVFKKSNEPQQAVQQMLVDEKNRKKEESNKKEKEATYKWLIQELYDAYKLVLHEECTAPAVYNTFITSVFEKCESIPGWQNDVKEILTNHKDKDFSKVALCWLKTWEYAHQVNTTIRGGNGR